MALLSATFAPEPQLPGRSCFGKWAGYPGIRAGPAAPSSWETVMKARVGDRLLPHGEQRRAGVIIGLQHADGSPPYVVKWRSGGHIALVFPGPYTKIVRGAPTSGTTAPAETPA